VHQWIAINAVPDALHRLRFKVLEDLYTLALSRDEGPVHSAKERFHGGWILVAVDAEEGEVEEGNGDSVHREWMRIGLPNLSCP